MSWINEQTKELLLAIVRHTPCCFLASRVDGDILWANDAFLDWSGYTLGELQSKSWMEISVEDENLATDINAAKHLDGYQMRYAVKKQYIPKHSIPKWGTLHVIRYPPTGTIECCLCVWEPLKSTEEISFSESKKVFNAVTEEVKQLREMLEQAEATSLVEKAMLIGIKLVVAYPKTASSLLLFLLLLIGGNTAFDVIDKMNKVLRGATP